MTDQILSILDDEPEDRELVKKTGDVLSEAQGLAIQTDEQFHYAGDVLRTIKGLQKEIDEYFEPMISKAHAAHKAALDAKKVQSEPLLKAERIIKGKVVQYHDEQERIRREEERRRQEELRKQEEEKRLQEAIDTGDESVLDEPVMVPEVQLEDTTKHEGIAYQEVWKFRVVDKAKVPEEYKVIDEVKVRGVVRATKGKINIPGIEAYADKIAKVRT